MAPVTKAPSLQQPSIELAALTSRPTYARADSGGLPLPVTMPLHARRAISSPIPMRVALGRSMSAPGRSPLHSPSGLSTVSFSSDTPLVDEAVRRSPLATPGRRPSIVHIPKILGRPTAYRPAYLLGLGNTGTTVFGLGEVILQRAIWPAQAYAGLDPDGYTLIPSGTPGVGVATGSKGGDLALGTTLMVAGLAAAVTASTFFFRDACALARRQNAENPALRRPRAYYAAHLVGLGCLVGNRFAAELFREYLSPNQSWLATVPGALGTAIFAVTQAQSFSSCELYNGDMPLGHRALIGQVARAGVSSWIILAALAGTPNMSSYVREGVKLVAQTSTAVAYSLSLTQARLLEAANPAPTPIGPVRLRGDFTAMQAFGTYTFARFLSSLSAAIFEYAEWPVKPGQKPKPAEPGGWRGLPQPLKTGAADPILVPEAVMLMGMALVAGAYSFWQMRKDALPRGRAYANTMCALAFLSLCLGETYRVVAENAKSRIYFEELWFNMPVGVAATALTYVVIPELMSQAEITQGNPELPHRYQLMEGSRFFGACLFTFWVGMNSIQFIPPLVRQCTATAASLATILGFALADGTIRRRQTGFATPAVERPSFM